MASVVHVLVAQGPLGVFIGMIFESLGLPVPSEVLLPFAGWLVYVGRTSFVDILALAVVAQIIGSLIGYAIGFFGGRPALAALERWTGRHELRMAEEWFGRWGPPAVFWGRFLPVVRTFISWPAGLSRMPLGRFVLWTFLGSIPWSAALIWIGERLGPSWSSAESPVQRFGTVVGVAIVLLVLFWAYRRLQERAKGGSTR